MKLFSKPPEIVPWLKGFADGIRADAAELASVQDSLGQFLLPAEYSGIATVVTSRDRPKRLVLVATQHRLLFGSAASGAMEVSAWDEVLGGTSVGRVAGGGFRLTVRLIGEPDELVVGSTILSQGLFSITRPESAPLVSVAHEIDHLFALE